MDGKSTIYIAIVIIIAVLVGAGLMYYYFVVDGDISNITFLNPRPNNHGSAEGATLQLAASQESYAVGEVIAVQVLLDTKGQMADGVDVLLNYDPAKMEPRTGTFIDSSKSVFKSIVGTQVEPLKKKLRFSAITGPGGFFKGQGEIATMNFIALVSGEAQLEIDYTKDLSTDSNISSFTEGKDILTGVDDLSINISK